MSPQFFPKKFFREIPEMGMDIRSAAGRHTNCEYPPGRGPADLVWLQMINLKYKNLYSWIEHYLVECAAVSDGASINDADKIELAKELEKNVTEGSFGAARTMRTLKKFVPGIRSGENVENKDLLFNLGLA